MGTSATYSEDFMAPSAGLPEPVDLQALCALARLRVPAEMQDELRRRLHAVLQSFASLSAIDTASAQLAEDLLAEDLPAEDLPADDLTAPPLPDAPPRLPGAPPSGPTVPALPSATGLRPDRAEPPMPTELALANAPRVALNAFLVPRVVEG
jgi:Asp-tRNA(Asn)/Glu-tRNA(Gln) amidotransferase C subunit